MLQALCFVQIQYLRKIMIDFVNSYNNKKRLISLYDIATIGNMSEEFRICAY